MRRFPLVVLALGVLAAPLPARADGGPPLDYADTSGLSRPVYATVHESVSVPMRDGLRLYAEVTRPSESAERFPVIVETSPFPRAHMGSIPGLPGDEAGEFGTFAGYFAPRGYAVVVADARGTNASPGCPGALDEGDALDGYDLVEWAAAQPWSNGLVAATGFGEEGSFALAAAGALPAPPHLRTAVVLGALAQAYDAQYQGGVPYTDWLFNPAGFAEPGWFAGMTRDGCEGVERARDTLPDHVSGRYTAWHASHDLRARAASADVPILAGHGFTDQSVHPMALDWVRMRGPRPGDKVWLGQWGHRPADRGAQWPGVLHRWLDRHLKGRTDVDTGPPVEVFLNPKFDVENVRDLNDPSNWMWRGLVRTGTEWPGTTTTLTLYPSLDRSPYEENLRLLSLERPPEGQDQWVASTQGRGMIFESPRFAADTVIAGFPEVILDVTILGGRVDLIATLYEVGFANRKITQASLNPELRNGLGTLTPVVPGERMQLRLPGQPHDFMVHQDSFLRLFVTSNDPDKFPAFAGPGVVQLHVGHPDHPTRVELGVVESPALYEDPRPRAE